MSEHRFSGVLYTPSLDELPDKYCAYFAKSPRFKMEKLLRAKMIDQPPGKEQTILYEDHERHLILGSKRKRAKPITEGQEHRPAREHETRKSIGRYKTMEAETIETMKIKIHRTLNRDLLDDGTLEMQREKQRKTCSPRRVHPRKKQAHESPRNAPDPEGPCPLTVKEAPFNNLARHGAAHKLNPILEKIEQARALRVIRPEYENCYSITLKKQLMQRKPSSRLRPMMARHLHSQKKSAQSLDFTPWEMDDAPIDGLL